MGWNARKTISGLIESANLLHDLYSHYNYYAHRSLAIRNQSQEYKRIYKMIFAHIPLTEDEFYKEFFPKVIAVEKLLKPYLQK